MKISSNGVQLNVSEQGKGGIALVFLHYWGGSARTWNPVANLFCREFRSIAIDLRGWGESEKPASGYSVRNQADDVEGGTSLSDIRWAQKLLRFWHRASRKVSKD